MTSQIIDRNLGIVQTTGVGSSTIITYAIPTNTSVYAKAFIIGKDASGNSAAREISALVKNVSGICTLVGAVQNISGLVTDLSLATVTVGMSISGTNLLITATGIALTTINWQAELQTWIN